LQIIHTIKEIYPEEFHWRQETSGRSHFDLLIGRSDTRHRLDAGDSPEKIAGFWSDDEEEFRQQRAKFLLYP
jgi:uncharacterized protein YbbC (DUF1343 family)